MLNGTDYCTAHCATLPNQRMQQHMHGDHCRQQEKPWDVWCDHHLRAVQCMQQHMDGDHCIQQTKDKLDVWRHHDLRHTLSKLNSQVYFITQLKYCYRCTAFLLPVLVILLRTDVTENRPTSTNHISTETYHKFQLVLPSE